MTRPPGSAIAFKTSSDIHAVAEYIAVFNYNVADIDPDAKFKALIERRWDIALLNATLNFQSAARWRQRHLRTRSGTHRRWS